MLHGLAVRVAIGCLFRNTHLTFHRPTPNCLSTGRRVPHQLHRLPGPHKRGAGATLLFAERAFLPGIFG